MGVSALSGEREGWVHVDILSLMGQRTSGHRDEEQMVATKETGGGGGEDNVWVLDLRVPAPGPR